MLRLDHSTLFFDLFIEGPGGVERGTYSGEKASSSTSKKS